MIYLLTHTDLDGIGCEIVVQYFAKCFKQDTFITHCEPADVDDKVEELIKHFATLNSETIKNSILLISDLSPTKKEAWDALDRLGKYLKGLSLYDHHQSAVEMAQNYEWAHVHSVPDECGTSVTYQCIINHLDKMENVPSEGLTDFLNNPLLEQFVNYVCEYDTWRFEKYSIPHKLELLRDAVGNVAFADMIFNMINDSRMSEFDPYYDYTADLIIDSVMTKQKSYIEKHSTCNVIGEIDGLTWGIAFAEKNISLVADNLLTLYPNCDIIGVVAMPKISIRTKKDNVNLSAIAKSFGGGGHQKAAGFTVVNGSDEFKQLLLKCFERKE